MTETTTALRYSAFTDTPDGGNPAGVVLDARGMSDDEMLALAARIGYSETAFLMPRDASEYDTRYFSPEKEISFCGHATIAAAVALAERDGTGDVVFHVTDGPVRVSTNEDAAGGITATLTSVAPYVEELPPGDLELLLSMLGWSADELDPGLPPKIGYAGARHLVLAARTRERLADLDYDFDRLKAFMLDRDLTTVDLVWRERADTYHARNPFPVGGVVEDPATGAAAAAFGAYLLDLGLATPPARIAVLQGDDMGRPSRLTIELSPGRPEISVTGRAIAIGIGNSP
jgi:PhzF family phenazine biosynthesis protein